MTSLILGTAFFVGIHLFISGTSLRDRVTGRIGEKPYLGLFALASLVGISWACSAYSNAPFVELWGELPGLAALATWIIMPIAFLLAVIGITTPSPTSMGSEGLLDGEEPATGILRITRHPFLSGVAIWAAVHLALNGDAASVVFFGGMLALALGGPAAIDGKRRRKFGARWEDFARVTSVVPFGAIVAGNNRLELREIAIWRIAAAMLAWAGMLGAHDSVFG